MEEIEGKPLAVIFDGTTHVEEAMAAVLRYVRSDWTIHQCLVLFLLVMKSMSGEEVA